MSHTKRVESSVFQLTVLGTRGSAAVSRADCMYFGGNTSCYMVQAGDETIFLDAGSGLLLAPTAFRKTPVILISHYHLDHIIGLCYLPAFIHNKKIRIYGPGRDYYPESVSYYLDALLREEFFSMSINSFSDDVQCVDYGDEGFCIGNISVGIKEQQHTSPSFRIALDDKLIYATDSTFNSGTWAGVSAEILFHECWEYKKTDNNRHASLWNIKTELPLANYSKIVLIHQNPEWSENDYSAISDMISGTNIVIGKDRMAFKI